MNGIEACRTCLSKDISFPMFYTIVHALSNRETLAKVLMDCTSVLVDKQDGYPQNICTTCIEKINQWIYFKDNCMQIDKQLRSELSGNEKVNCNVVCRTCLSNDTFFPMFYTIVHALGRRETLAKVLLDCTSVVVDQQDSLPQNMCTTCIEKINQWLFFKDKCTQIDQQLRFELSSNEKTNSWEQTTEDCEDIENKNVNSSITTPERIIYKKAISIQQVVSNKETQKYIRSVPSKLEVESFINNIQNAAAVKVLKKRKRKKDLCEICGGQFSKVHRHRKTHYRTHQSKHIRQLGKRDCTCSLCSKTFKHPGRLMLHMKRHSNLDLKKKPNLPCDLCDRQFTNKKSLRHHKVRCHNEKPSYICPVCGKGYGFRYPCCVKRRRKYISGLCQYCGKSFMDKSYLRVHTWIHTGKKPYQCNICDKRFTQAPHLKTHMSIHGLGTIYKCDYCDRTFLNKYTLIIHERIHTGEKPFECKSCSQRFIAAPYLKNHMKSHIERKQRNLHNSSEEELLCKYCNKKFKSHFYLKVHLRIHTGENLFECNVCSKKYALASHLENHLRVHLSTKSFKSTSFSTPSLSELSERKQHICLYCNNRYTTKHSLTNHLRTHTGEKPYQCKICLKKFHAHGILSAHEKRHQKN